MYTSANMGLAVWNLLDDPFDHDQLENNWAIVDTHRHVPGQGLQIPTAGLADSAVTTNKIADLAVTDPKIADATITGDKLVPGTIIDANIAEQTITGDKLVNGTITDTQIANQTITGDRLVDGTITTTQIQDGTILAADVAAGTLTDVQVASGNKDGTSGALSLRTLGTGAQQACAGNDARLSDARAPGGGAGGDLAGTYPNPTINSAATPTVTGLTVTGNVGVIGSLLVGGSLGSNNIKWGTGTITVATASPPNKGGNVTIVHGLIGTPSSIQLTLRVDALTLKEASSGGVIIGVDHEFTPPTGTTFTAYVVANTDISSSVWHFDWVAFA